MTSRLRPRAKGWIAFGAQLFLFPTIACEAPSPTLTQGPAAHAVAKQLPEACGLLVEVAERARRCDPRLASLAAELRANPEAAACTQALRNLIDPGAHAEARVHSLFEPATGIVDASELSGDEVRRVREINFPGHVEVHPDRRPGPGVPPTAVRVSSEALDVELDGRLHAHADPGPHELQLQHAGLSSAYCLTLGECEKVSLTAHGAKLAPHPRIKGGPCPAPPSRQDTPLPSGAGPG